ncbi:procollagen C-endopeptidase enhancer 2 isoform X1 [Pangasianodon hypophthalmus]|uniref:procollagen C-endopeptidase enhancer 2 isoform X1 n=1 Tax=Pangasianodon hypophthalmus TaxID=310915 RepID=UPI001479FD6E|nr:procollagen C-endopeptidase enhancer 2 isoform X1 [Pangasianodon hypophthalmus]
MWTVTWSVWVPLVFGSVFGQRQQRPMFTCGGNITGTSGLIGSQGYPGVYPPNTKCVWRITVPQGKVVSLTFRSLDLESDGLCRYDYVDVYDGFVNSQRLGRFCGTARPGALISNHNRMQVVMVSDANTAGSGFLAGYAAVRPNARGERYCGGLLDKPSGTFMTPNWPERDYPPGVTCSWHIIAPKHQIIELKFEKFDVERDNYCRYDHMVVYNGAEMSEATRIGKFCGDSPPAPIYSDGSHLFIQFISDLSLTADGFICHYTFKPKNSTITGSPVPVTAAAPTTAGPIALAYSEALCKQKCKRSGTIENHYCLSNFVQHNTVEDELISRCRLVTVLTGTLVSAAMREQSVLATFSITNVYKEGNLSIQQAGKSMSTKVTILCKKCPLVRRGLNYIVMGHVDEQGQGIVSPQNFVMPFKTKKQKDLAVLNNVRC